MKVWVLQDIGVRAGYWTGEALVFTSEIDEAVQFVRQDDANRILAGNLLLSAMPAEVELPDRDEPGGQSAASHHGDGDAVNIKGSD